MKREVWHGGIMNGADCRRLIKNRVEIINKI